MKINVISLLVLSLFGFSESYAIEKQDESSIIIEVVIWKPIDGVSEEEVSKSARMVNRFMDQQQGFIRREVAKNNKGEWVDIVYWDSLNHAQVASQAAQVSETCQPFFQTIDMQSMQFYHFESKFTHQTGAKQ